MGLYSARGEDASEGFGGRSTTLSWRPGAISGRASRPCKPAPQLHRYDRTGRASAYLAGDGGNRKGIETEDLRTYREGRRPPGLIGVPTAKVTIGPSGICHMHRVSAHDPGSLRSGMDCRSPPSIIVALRRRRQSRLESTTNEFTARKAASLGALRPIATPLLSFPGVVDMRSRATCVWVFPKIYR